MINTFTKKELTVLNGILNSVNTLASTHIPFTKSFGLEEYLEEKLSLREIDDLHEKLILILREKK